MEDSNFFHGMCFYLDSQPNSLCSGGAFEEKNQRSSVGTLLFLIFTHNPSMVELKQQIPFMFAVSLWRVSQETKRNTVTMVS